MSRKHRVSGRINPRRNSLRHMVMKLTEIKDKGKILKATREKRQVTYKSINFSTGTLQTRRDWHDIFQVMKGENLQPRLLYPTKLSFKFDGEIKSFSDKQKLG